MFETFGYETPTVPVCPALGFYNVAEARAMDTQISHGTGIWPPFNSGNVTEDINDSMPCFNAGTYKFQHNSTYRDWIVCGPSNTNCV
jgi:hypothetical protein